jgi:hypothetical protein
MSLSHEDLIWQRAAICHLFYIRCIAKRPSLATNRHIDERML